jgi:GNAT superfamily N-acetyltransferase
MAEYQIREAQLQDLPGAIKCLEALYNEETTRSNGPFKACNPQRLKELLTAGIHSKSRAVFLLETNGVILGLVAGVVARLDGRYQSDYGDFYGRFTELYLAPQARGKGLAKVLAAKMEEWFRLCGVKYIELDILEGNTVSDNLFGGMGYAELSRTVYKVL